MSHLLKTLTLFAVIATTPALATEPDPHAERHPAAAADAAKAPASATTPPEAGTMGGCPMMADKMPPAPGPMAGKAPDGPMMGAMMGGKDMRCMNAPAATDGAHDHPHPDAPPPK